MTYPLPHRLYSLLLALLCLSLSGLATAAGMGLVTGSTTGTYYRFGNEMAEVAGKVGVAIEVKNSEGSLANIRRMASNENAAMGIVQSDVLSFLARSEDPEMKRIATDLRLIFPFYNEEVHVFARKEVKSFADLAGKRLALGTKGSGSWLTAVNLLRMTGVEPGEIKHMKPKRAAREVVIGGVDAMIFVGGKPVPFFVDMEDLRNNPVYMDMFDHVHFITLDHPAVLKEYEAATITRADYPWMPDDVKTVTVKAALISYDFSNPANTYHAKRCKQIRKLGDTMRQELPKLRQNGHAKWQEVNLDAGIGIWQLDRCSRDPSKIPVTQTDLGAQVACIISGKCN